MFCNCRLLAIPASWALSIAIAELDKNEPIHCPKCSAVFRLKSEQMKHLAPGRKPVKD
jgi:hypothetical protein